MQMGDKDMIQTGKLQPGAAQLHLRTLSTVDHKQLFTQLHDLGRREMARGRQKRNRILIYVASNFSISCKDRVFQIQSCKE